MTPHSLPVNIHRAQYLAIAGSLVLFLFILNLIRKKNIREEYSLTWLFISLVFIVFSFWRQGLEIIARMMGIDYAPAALFLILLIAVFIILIEFSVIISGLSEKNKTLVQEVGLLKMDVEMLNKSQAKLRPLHRKVKKQPAKNDGK